MLQLNLKQSVKETLRQSFDDLIGAAALGKEQPASSEAARQAAVRGQNKSSIGAVGNGLYGGRTMKRIFNSVSGKFEGETMEFREEGHRASIMLEHIANNLPEAAKAAAQGLEAFVRFLDTPMPR